MLSFAVWAGFGGDSSILLYMVSARVIQTAGNWLWVLLLSTTLSRWLAWASLYNGGLKIVRVFMALNFSRVQKQKLLELPKAEGTVTMSLLLHSIALVNVTGQPRVKGRGLHKCMNTERHGSLEAVTVSHHLSCIYIHTPPYVYVFILMVRYLFYSNVF